MKLPMATNADSSKIHHWKAEPARPLHSRVETAAAAAAAAAAAEPGKTAISSKWCLPAGSVAAEMN
jgi:hypothetical protein